MQKVKQHPETIYCWAHFAQGVDNQHTYHAVNIQNACIKKAGFTNQGGRIYKSTIDIRLRYASKYFFEQNFSLFFYLHLVNLQFTICVPVAEILVTSVDIYKA